jgi:hypothetical protein
MSKLFLIFTLLISLNLQASDEVIELTIEEINTLSSTGILSVFGEVSGIGGKIALSRVDSFVTLKNEIIPYKNASITISQGKSSTTDNILSIRVGEISINRNELLGVILKQ